MSLDPSKPMAVKIPGRIFERIADAMPEDVAGDWLVDAWETLSAGRPVRKGSGWRVLVPVSTPEQVRRLAELPRVPKGVRQAWLDAASAWEKQLSR